MYTLCGTTRLRSMSLKTLKLHQYPGILLLIVGRYETDTLASDLPVWEAGDTELTECLPLNKILCMYNY